MAAYLLWFIAILNISIWSLGGRDLLRDLRRNALLARTAIRAGNREAELPVFGFCLGPFDAFAIWADVSRVSIDGDL